MLQVLLLSCATMLSATMLSGVAKVQGAAAVAASPPGVLDPSTPQLDPPRKGVQARAQPPQRPRPWLSEVRALHQLGELGHQLIQLFQWGLRVFLAGRILCSRRDTPLSSSW